MANVFKAKLDRSNCILEDSTNTKQYKDDSKHAISCTSWHLHCTFGYGRLAQDTNRKTDSTFYKNVPVPLGIPFPWPDNSLCSFLICMSVSLDAGSVL